MRRHSLAAWTIAATTTLPLAGCGQSGPRATLAAAEANGFAFTTVDLSGCQTTDIAARLACIPGLYVHEVAPSETDIPAGYREFELLFEQPVDHAHPEAGAFKQRLVLLHHA